MAQDNTNWAQQCEQKGDWGMAALSYLEASKSGEALRAILRVRTGDEKTGSGLATLTSEKNLLLMKRFDILERAVQHLISQDIETWNLATYLEKIGEFILSGNAQRSIAETANSYRYYSKAAELFARGGSKNEAIECLIKGCRSKPSSIPFDYLHEIYQMGVLDEFIEPAVKDKSLAVTVMKGVSDWGRRSEDKYTKTFDEWEKRGGLHRFVERMLQIDPFAVGHYYYLSERLQELDTSSFAQCYDAAMHSASLTNEEKKEVSLWAYVMAERFQKHGEFREAARFWSESTHFGSAADCYLKLEDYFNAATMIEKQAKESFSGAKTWLLDRVAKILERVGNNERAAQLYRQCNRMAKAARVEGRHKYDLEEIKSMPPLYNALTVDDSRSFVRGRFDFSPCTEAANAYSKGDVSATVAAWKIYLESNSHIYEQWYLIPELYKRDGDTKSYRTALQNVEQYFRNRGEWILAVKMYFSDEQYDEFDRVCIEEDELEIAALWYEQTEMHDRLAKIYALIDQRVKGASVNSSDTTSSKSTPDKDTSETKPPSDATSLLFCPQPQCGRPVQSHWLKCPDCKTQLKQKTCPNPNCREPLESHWTECPACETPV